MTHSLLAILVAVATHAPAAALTFPLSVLPRFQRAWQRRGNYDDRPDVRPLRDVASVCGVDPPWKAPRWVWQAAWTVGRGSMPLLHRWDPCRPTDTNVNLWVCWLKAIAGNRRRGGYEDGGFAHDLLPSVTRVVVARPIASLYPPLHHQNVALRTAFLDRALYAELRGLSADEEAVVTVLGAGFDARAVRMATHVAPGEEEGGKEPALTGIGKVSWAEVDLPHVVEQKRRLLARLVRRRPAVSGAVDALVQCSANLTRTDEARTALRQALAPLAQTCQGGEDGGRGVAIFVLEALLIYVPPTAASSLLRACVDEAAAAGAAHVSIVFADRLPEVDGCSMDSARDALGAAHLELDEASWLPKPGLARHMGVARWARQAV